MLEQIRRRVAVGALLVVPLALTACASSGQAVLHSTPSNASSHSQQGAPCTTPPVQAVQVTTNSLNLNVGDTASFTACAQFAGDFAIVASPSGIVSVPSSVTPAVGQDDGIKLATIIVTGVAPGTATITVADKKGNTATVTVTVVAPYDAYISQANSIVVYSETGTLLKTLPIPASELALDDGGNIYALKNNYNLGSAMLARYAPGSTTPNATYSPPSDATDLMASGAGELATFSGLNNPPGAIMSVWKQGSPGGAADYTLSAGFLCTPAYVVAHDGTVYASQAQNGVFTGYAVYAPGSSVPTRTIPETIVPPSEFGQFCPNYDTVGPDGTFYVTEYTYDDFGQPDPLAGLYIYPPSGPERFVPTTSDSNGAGPQGVDLDAAGNIYVANDNEAVVGIDNNGNFIFSPDTLREVEVFAPGATSVLRHITGNFDPHPITVAPDGTVFIGSFGFPIPSDPSVNGVFLAAPGATTVSQISTTGANSIVLYNGFQEATAYEHQRRTSSIGASSSSAHAGGRSLFNFRRLLVNYHRGTAGGL